jgi:hypothetical protein
LYSSLLRNIWGGENLNKKILVIPVLLLTLALFSIPVMCAPARKIDVTATLLLTTTEGVGRYVDHGILQFRESTVEGSAILTLPGQTPIEGTYFGELNGRIKLDHPAPGPWFEAEGLMSGKTELSFPGGTFVGIRNFKTIGFPPPVMSYMDTRMVLHGTGDFKGQTLILSFEGDPPIPAPFDVEGYLIMPK